ncbi:HK97-gp10 family putative phage morphogenesis protein [Pseudogemmobacter faecipullorum]|uniref:HK97 gp10 family phage protein n=1 Tax=Pseudogemmobacter faecipullorum TaxID=2755041 RepID=A0ABS8CR67_9RHOB|nr:HK97-gp10 family putative phage morphogenesis protein [Pseudogemmobacter faecipullorum]MCB5411882.1 HK97 gp10 family phage protein [Pseudogemmobacter faecipullorum]
MARYVQGADALKRKLAALPAAVAAALNPALKKSAEEIAADARALAEASRRTGSLADSIDATGPGETTPAYAADGGKRTAEDGQAFVTAGSPEARHGHLVEFGTEERHHKDGTSTGTMPAEPFLLPAWRLNMTRVKNRLRRVIRAEAKKVAQQ